MRLVRLLVSLEALGRVQAALFSISGDAELYSSDTCFQTDNYPSSYANNDIASITCLFTGTIYTSSFITESDYDYFYIGSSAYSGSQGSLTFSVTQGQVLEWDSDSSVVSSGFRFCATSWSTPEPSVAPTTPKPTPFPDTIEVKPNSPSGPSNCYPFGGTSSSWSPAGFVYKNIPAFQVASGQALCFDLGAANDYIVYLDIYFSETTSNGGTTASGYTQVCTNCAASGYGDTTQGNYDFCFTLESSYAHNYGGFIIKFVAGASDPSDSSCSQVLMSGSSTDSSNYFVQRFYAGSSGTTDIGGFVIDPHPTALPTPMPTPLPSRLPIPVPTRLPTPVPSPLPTTPVPSKPPTPMPSSQPTPSPTLMPSALPTPRPSPLPTTPQPSPLPTTPRPSPPPTFLPSPLPTRFPTPTPTTLPSPLPSPVPSSRPTPLPSSNPTPRPTPLPTLLPTSLPTTLPTVLPSPLPTVLPSPQPTTPFPSSLPTPLPSPLPTTFPSSLPTALPTPLPTTLPSSLPTPVPTPDCGYGTYLLDGQCHACPKGRFSNTSATLVFSCTACEVGRFAENERSEYCDDCPSGTYQGRSGSSNCSSCTSGKYAPLRGSWYCEDCPGGKYQGSSGSKNCSNCIAGTYSITVGATSTSVCTICNFGKHSSSGSMNCTLCPSDTYNNDLATSSELHDSVDDCTACEKGYFSTETRDRCKVCTAGEYTSAQTCHTCAKGKYAPQALTNACLDCPAGFHTEKPIGATTCTSCNAGTFSPGFVVNCSDCPVGKYSSTSAVQCSNCTAGTYTNTGASAQCTDCAAGRYQSKEKSVLCLACPAGRSQGSAGQILCISCEPGYYSLGNATACTACPAGRFVNVSGSISCTDCPSGREQSAAAQAECITCDAGTFAIPDSSSCSECPEGKSSAAEQRNCTTCDAGKYAPVSSSECLNCTAGTYASSAGTGICTDCAAGHIQRQEGSTKCTQCSPGWYQADSGQRACKSCDAGYFAPQPGATLCLKCSTEEKYGPEFTSVDGSRNCSRCVAGYFMDRQEQCQECPTGADCTTSGTTLTNLVLDQYYYRFTTTSTEVYKCPQYFNCIGGNASGEDLCSSGSHGPLCSTCLPGYYVRATVHICTSCGDSADLWWLGPFVAVLVVLCLAVGVHVKREPLKRWYSVWIVPNYIDLSSRAIALFVTMQIIVLYQANYLTLGGLGTPPPYGAILNYLEQAFQLNIIGLVPADCIVHNDWTHVDSLLFETLTPLILLVGLLLYILSRKVRKMSTRQNEFLGYYMTLMLLILPTISRRIAQTYRCNEFDDGAYVRLAVDYAVDCLSPTYTFCIVYSTIMVLIYPVGLPALMWVVLNRSRLNLNPPGISEEEAMDVRDHNPSLKKASIVSFALKYRPKFWWFDLLVLLRRLVLTSVVLIFDSEHDMNSFALFFASGMVLLEKECEPYVKSKTSSAIYFLQWQVVLYIEALVLVDNAVTDSLGDAVVGWALLLTNVALLTLVVSNQWGHHKRMAKLRESLMTNTIELAESHNPISENPTGEHFQRNSDIWDQFGDKRMAPARQDGDANKFAGRSRVESAATKFDNPLYEPGNTTGSSRDDSVGREYGARIHSYNRDPIENPLFAALSEQARVDANSALELELRAGPTTVPTQARVLDLVQEEMGLAVEIEAETNATMFSFSDAAQTSVLDSTWKKRLENVDEGFVIGYENTSEKMHRLQLDFSESTNMEIKELFGAEEIQPLIASLVVAPGGMIVVKLGSVDQSKSYGYKVALTGQRI